MRLMSILLEKYGPFSRLAVTLDPQKLNLLLAPNGAGKSVLRCAIHDLLFGIHAQTPMGFRFGYDGIRLAAEAVVADGTLRFGRRKGRGNTLTDAAGSTLDPAKLSAMIGNFDSTRFEQLLALDSRILREGAEALLQSGGDLHDALFATAGSMTTIRDILHGLQGERDEIAPDRLARTKPLYVALEAWEAARKQQRDSTQIPQKRAESEHLLQEAKDKRAMLTTRESELRAQRARLQRVRRVRSPLRIIDEQNTVLQSIEPSILALPLDLTDRWTEANGSLSRATAKRDTCQSAVNKADGELGRLEVDQLVLREADSISALADQAIETRADHRDLPKREFERAEADSKLQQRLSDLGMALPADSEPALPDPVLLVEAEKMIEAWRKIELDRDRASRQIEAIKDAQTKIDAELASLPEPFDIGPVKALVEEATLNGAPATVERRLQSDLTAAETALVAARAKVPGWTGDLEGLIALVPPPPEMSGAIAGQLNEAHILHNEASKACKDLEGKCAEQRDRLSRLRTGEPLPEPVTIQAARDRRDQGWTLIRGIAFERTVTLEDIRIEEWAGADPMPDAFEAAILKADRLADSRDAEAERLARVAQAESDLADTAAQLEKARSNLAVLEAALAAATARWAYLLTRHGLPAELTPADASMLLDARVTVVGCAERSAVCRAELERERTAQTEWASRLATILRATRAPLTELLAAARTSITEAGKSAGDRLRLQGQLDNQVNVLRQHNRELSEANASAGQWRDAWTILAGRLGRPVEEGPEGTAHALQLIADARTHLKDRRELDHRIFGMRNNIDAFERAALALVDSAGPDLVGSPATEVVRILGERREKALADEGRRKALSDQKSSAERDLGDAETERSNAIKALALVRQDIGANDDAAAIMRLEAANKAREAHRAITSAEAALAETGDGLAVDALRDEVTAQAHLDLDQSIALIDAELGDLGPQRDAAVGSILKLELEQAAQERDTAARDANADRMLSAARLARIGAEALRLDLAASILDLAMKRLRSTSTGGIADRISQVFARLTGRTYTGLEVDEEDGQPILYAQSTDGARKKVDELSEGTRDQLFLAMRLAVLADLAGRAPLPPLVADDLLQTFDDDRTAHTLAELSNFCAHSQVIVLTHHRHVVDLARRLPADKIHICDLQMADAS